MSIGGLDVGTTVCRLIAFDESGKMLAGAFREYPLIITAENYRVIDPTKLWQSVCEVFQEVASKIKNDPLEAVAVSAMGGTLIATDAQYEPVYHAILAFDTRSQPQCDQLIRRFGFEKLHRVTGMPPNPMATATKILWMMDSANDKNKPPARFMCTEDFVIARLTGRPLMSWSSAAWTMMYDGTTKQWWPEVCDYMKIGREKLSEVAPSATVAGKILPHIAAKCELPPHMIIATAGHDQICSAIGSGAVSDGMVSDNTGTFECVIAGIGANRADTVDKSVLVKNKLPFYAHGPKDLLAAFAWVNAGSIVNWCRDILFALEKKQAEIDKKNIYEMMFSALDDKPTKVQFLPHLTGTGTPWLDPEATGVLVGLDLSTSKHEVLKAIVQGIGYDLVLNFEGFAKAGIRIDKIRATGGGSRSPNWVQLKADMTGKEITVVQVTEASALGAAICAGIAAGKFASFVEAAEHMVALGKTYTPNMEKHEKYMAGVRRHRMLYNAILQYRVKLPKLM